MMEKVVCANCGDKIPEHEAWLVGDEWACGIECENILNKKREEEEDDSQEG